MVSEDSECLDQVVQRPHQDWVKADKLAQITRRAVKAWLNEDRLTRGLKEVTSNVSSHLHAVVTGLCMNYHLFGSDCVHAFVSSTLTCAVMQYMQSQAASIEEATCNVSSTITQQRSNLSRKWRLHSSHTSLIHTLVCMSLCAYRGLAPTELMRVPDCITLSSLMVIVMIILFISISLYIYIYTSVYQSCLAHVELGTCRASLGSLQSNRY